VTHQLKSDSASLLAFLSPSSPFVSQAGFLGYASTVLGAYNEAIRVADSFDNSISGRILGSLNATGTFFLAVGAGIIDDALGAATMGAAVLPSIEAHGSGPVQHAVGSLVRALVRWR
jgi:hypothetical protein